jgi:hypothetical protein
MECKGITYKIQENGAVRRMGEEMQVSGCTDVSQMKDTVKVLIVLLDAMSL